MSYVRIWVHLVFSTKNRGKLLSKNIRHEVNKHIIDNCITKGIFLQAINGHNDHLHCLISLGRDQTIAQVTHLIKGESSFWINSNKLTLSHFAWQDDYFAVSISESHVKVVTNYIKNQEKHHANKSYAEEVDEFVTKYGFVLIKDK